VRADVTINGDLWARIVFLLRELREPSLIALIDQAIASARVDEGGEADASAQ
jgi:hypothetical protein